MSATISEILTSPAAMCLSDGALTLLVISKTFGPQTLFWTACPRRCSWMTFYRRRRELLDKGFIARIGESRWFCRYDFSESWRSYKPTETEARRLERDSIQKAERRAYNLAQQRAYLAKRAGDS